MAQADIKQFYDFLQPMKLAKWVCARGLDWATCLTFLRLHCLLSISLSVGQSDCHISGRSCGVMTGTRSAVVAGRIPLIDAAVHRMHYWDQLAFKAGDFPLSMATFVDNLFSTGRDPWSAAAILDDAALFLRDHWELEIGEGSRMVLTGAGLDVNFEKKGWKHCSVMRCLGHYLCNKYTIEEDFQKMESSVWAGFFANLQPGLMKSPLQTRVRFLQSCVRPIAGFRWSRWPFQRTYAARLDGIQAGMVAKLQRVERHVGEMDADFFARRRQMSFGLWSKSWAKSCMTWEAHILRAHDPGSWSHRIFSWKAESWMHAQRLAASSGSSLARTNTRASQGRPATRWYEGLTAAKNF